MAVSLKRYILVFLGSYLGLGLVIGVIATLLNIDIKGMSASIPMIAAFFAGSHFVKRESRIPTKSEKRSLINWSFLAVLLFNVIVGLILYYSGMLSEALPVEMDSFTTKLIAFVVVFVLLLSYLSIWFGYGFLTRKHAEREGL